MSRQKRILIGGTAMFLIVGLGVAIAAWLVTGSGNGAAKAGELTTINVNAGTADRSLYPGGTGSLELSVTNPNTWRSSSRRSSATVQSPVTRPGATAPT